MQKYKSNIITTTGLAQRNVSVRVLDDNGALATLYADRYGQTPIANPQVTAVDGTFAFYAANGRYSLQTTINGVTYTDQDVVLAADPEDMLVAGPIADAVNSATASVLATATNAASAAQASQNAAAGSQSAAAASESNAAGSASAASGSAATASGAAGAASASEANAHASENAAATSAGNAATSESNALASKNAAAAAAANAATYAQGYANGGAYAAGITLNDRFTFVTKDGELYRVADSVALPYTTTGNWASEASQFVAIGDRNLRQDLANTDKGGAALVAFSAIGAGAVAKTVQDRLRETRTVTDFGAIGDGVADDTAALTAANTVAGAGGLLTVPPGTYKIASAITISAALSMAPGAVLKPAAGIKVTLTNGVTAGLYQIFDRSGGGAIEFGSGMIPTVYAEWWGARPGRTDNEKPIQNALDAVQSVIYADFTTPAPNGDNSGGIVVLGYSCAYPVSGMLLFKNRAILRGQGRYSEITANNTTWNPGHTQMFVFQNGTSSQFWCRLDNLSVNANENTVLGNVIYAPSWQESCGLRDVLIRNFRCHALYIDNGYGGAVGARLQSVQFMPSTAITSGQHAIHVDIPYTDGVYNLLLEEVSFAGGFTVPGVGISGCYANGRVRIQCRGVHSEGFDYGFNLDTDASLYGVIGAGGNSSTAELITLSSTWTGQIDLERANKGGAAELLHSYTGNGSGVFKNEPIFGRLTYPHPPGQTLAYARNTAAGGALDSTAFGFSSIGHPSTGNYTLYFDTTKIAPDVPGALAAHVEIGTVAGFTYYVNTITSTYISLIFLNLSGITADCDLFDVYLYGRPQNR